jgi:hypothetical protein
MLSFPVAIMFLLSLPSVEEDLNTTDINGDTPPDILSWMRIIERTGKTSFRFTQITGQASPIISNHALESVKNEAMLWVDLGMMALRFWVYLRRMC